MKKNIHYVTTCVIVDIEYELPSKYLPSVMSSFEKGLLPVELSLV